MWSQARTTSVSATKSTTTTCTSTGYGGRETIAQCSLIILPLGIIWFQSGKPLDLSSILPTCWSALESFAGQLLSFFKTVGIDVCGQKSGIPPDGSNKPPIPEDGNPAATNNNDPQGPNDDDSPKTTDEPHSEDPTSRNPSTTSPKTSTISASTKAPGSSSGCVTSSVATTSACITIQGGKTECVTSMSTAVVPCSRTVSKVSSTSSTPSSSGTTARYLLIPSLTVSEAAKQSFFAAHLANLPKITTSILSDGTVDLWVVPLNASQSNSVQTLMSGFGHFIPESIRIDDGDTQNENIDQSQTRKRTEPQVPYRSHLLSKRAPATRSQYESEPKAWDFAIISQPREISVPIWDIHKDDYTYVRDNTVDAGKGVRVYVVEEGIDMTHPEFSSRAPGADAFKADPWNYEMSWIFADNDPYELITDSNGVTGSYATSWLDPNDPNPPRAPLSGLPRAYTNIGGHGTSVASLIFGDTLGKAPFADVTIVKVYQYLNGPLDARLTMFSIRSGLRKVLQDIMTRKQAGEDGFVINCSFGAENSVYGLAPTFWPRDAVANMYIELLDHFNALGVSVVFVSGNSAGQEHLVRAFPCRTGVFTSIKAFIDITTHHRASRSDRQTTVLCCRRNSKRLIQLFIFTGI